MKQVWVVETRIDDDNPVTYGPYTEAQAERVAAKLQEEANLATDDYGGSHHPHSILGAGAYPISRYDNWLTAEQRREARREVRESSREVASRQS